MNYNQILEQALELAKRERPNASAQHQVAFANSVAYLVTGFSGGYGGPSVREHAASCQYATGKQYSYEEATQLLLAEDGPIFGPLTDLHRRIWNIEYCFDDDPADEAALVD